MIIQGYVRKPITVPLTRIFSVLNLYDLLANLVPGLAWVVLLSILFPVDWFSLSAGVTPVAYVAVIIVFGFIAGHIIQWAGSNLDRWLIEGMEEGKDLFSRTMEAIESGQEKSPIGPITDVEESFWELAKEQFGLPSDFPKNSKLLVLVLSYLETRPATRASRFQAIHTFHRSMWAASFFSVISAAVSLLAALLGMLELRPITPFVILIGSFGGLFVFDQRKDKFEKTFLRYVFLDFYQDQKVKKHDRNS